MRKNIKIFAVILLACLMSVPALSEKKVDKKEIKEVALNGLWAFKGQRVNGSAFTPSPVAIFKSIMNGKYISFMTRSGGAVITAQGDIEVQADSVLIEKVQDCISTATSNKTNRLAFKLKDNKQLYVKFLIERKSGDEVQKLWYEEVWEKQEMQSFTDSPLQANR